MIIAPFKRRIDGFLIDYLIIAGYGTFIVGTISVIFRPFIQPMFLSSAVTAQLTGFFLITLPISLYFILCESSTWQGTIGKKKMGIQVVNNIGQRMNIWRSITRTAIKLLPWEVAHFAIWRLMLPSNFSEITLLIILSAVNLAIIIFLITPFTNKQRKNVYDWIAKTKVILKKERKTHK